MQRNHCSPLSRGPDTSTRIQRWRHSIDCWRYSCKRRSNCPTNSLASRNRCSISCFSCDCAIANWAATQKRYTRKTPASVACCARMCQKSFAYYYITIGCVSVLPAISSSIVLLNGIRVFVSRRHGVITEPAREASTTRFANQLNGGKLCQLLCG